MKLRTRSSPGPTWTFPWLHRKGKLQKFLVSSSEAITIQYDEYDLTICLSSFVFRPFFFTHSAPDPSTIPLIEVWSIGITLCELVTSLVHVNFSLSGLGLMRNEGIMVLETEVGCHFEAHVWQLLAQWTFTQRSR